MEKGVMWLVNEWFSKIVHYDIEPDGQGLPTTVLL